VRSDGVVVPAPSPDLLPGIGEIREDLDVQALVPKAPLKRFDEATFAGFAGGGEVELDALGERPGVERFAGELAPVVGQASEF
jgi:hypothetical protein